VTAKFKVTAGKLRCVKKWGSKRIDKSCLKEFWDEVGSGNRRGVYIFAIRAAKGWKPLYVGRTKKQTFRTRVGQHVHDRGRFNTILRRIKKGTPWLFFIGRVGSGKSSNVAIDILEIEVINYAFARNEDLDNDRGIEKPKYEVLGFGSAGKTTQAVIAPSSLI
jgi:hypothetical protein